MSLNYAFDRDDVFPSFFANRVQDQISGLDSKLWLKLITTNTVQVSATAGDGIVSLFVEGRWRFVTAPIQRVASGAAGWRTVWATAADSVIVSSPEPFTDNTDYSFSLLLTTEGVDPVEVPGSVEVWTRIGRLYWDGAKIVHLQPLIGYRPRPAGELVFDVGVTDGMPDPPGLIKADSALVNIADFPAVFGRVGHVHSGGADPGGGKFRLPDGRGRFPVGRGTHSAVNAIGKSDAMSQADRSPSHAHVVDGHSHAVGDHTHSVPGHWHSRGTLAVGSAGGVFNTWADDQGSSGQFGLWGWFNTVVSPTMLGAHTHPLTGVIGNPSGANGDSALTTSVPSSSSTGAASPATSSITVPYLVGTWFITTGE